MKPQTQDLHVIFYPRNTCYTLQARRFPSEPEPSRKPIQAHWQHLGVSVRLARVEELKIQTFLTSLNPSEEISQARQNLLDLDIIKSPKSSNSPISLLGFLFLLFYSPDLHVQVHYLSIRF
jgi:hypothetical protein